MSQIFDWQVRQTEVKSKDQQFAPWPVGSLTWQRHHADSDSPEAESTSMQYTLHWHDRQTQHIHWLLAQRHTNTGHSSVRVILIKCQNCNELHNTAVIELIKTLAWLQICENFPVNICMSFSAELNKNGQTDAQVNYHKQFSNKRGWERGWLWHQNVLNKFQNEETLYSAKKR